MDCNYIRDKAYKTIIECNVKCFPIDCFQLLAHYGYKIYSYSELYKKNKELYDMCVGYSEDAFRSGSFMIVAYNDKKPLTRVRFSLMHELGHHILKHKNDLPENELEANYFANNILAPRIAMYYAKCRTVKEVSDLFKISSRAAYYAAQDFSEWCIDIRKNGMHTYDKELYQQFHNRDYGGFVYSIKNVNFVVQKYITPRTPFVPTAANYLHAKTGFIGIVYLIMINEFCHGSKIIGYIILNNIARFTNIIVEFLKTKND